MYHFLIAQKTFHAHPGFLEAGRVPSIRYYDDTGMSARLNLRVHRKWGISEHRMEKRTDLCALLRSTALLSVLDQAHQVL